MTVLCAWCQQEDRPALLREVGSSHSSLPSHGICKVHEEIVFSQIEALRKKKRIRLTPRRSLPTNQATDCLSTHVSAW